MENILSSSLLHPAPFADLPGVESFVTTRCGGVSRGEFRSFNCSPYTDDDPSAVRSNLELLAGAFRADPADFVIPHQVHRTTVGIIDKRYHSMSDEQRRLNMENVDGLVTDLPGLFLCVSTADCLSVFLYDPVQRAVGIAHSGWRGTVKHIAPVAVYAMEKTYGSRAEDLQVAFGPCISLQAFEVGNEVYATFKEASFPMDRIAARCMEADDEGLLYSRWHISLQEAVAADLTKMGVPDAHIRRCPVCTRSDERFFSARRQGIRSGRILNGIRLL